MTTKSSLLRVAGMLNDVLAPFADLAKAYEQGTALQPLPGRLDPDRVIGDLEGCLKSVERGLYDWAVRLVEAEDCILDIAALELQKREYEADEHRERVRHAIKSLKTRRGEW